MPFDHTGEHSTLSRGGGSAWCTLWPTYADKFPAPRPPAWVPDRAGRVVVLCLRFSGTATAFRSFPTVEPARAAEIDRAGRPCCAACQGAHSICFGTPGKLHIERSSSDRFPVPSDLAAAFAQAYPPRSRYSQNGHHRKEALDVTRKPDTPDEEPAVTEPTDDEQAQRIIDAERKAGRHLARLGVNRRAALAHREHADLIAAGASPEQIAAAEMVAKALSDAALAAIDPDE
jgi:hypothetical protein